MAGYFNLGLGIGEAAGPISAGILVETFGFRSSCDVLGFVMLTYTLVYFTFNGNFSLLLPEKSPKTEETKVIYGCEKTTDIK